METNILRNFLKNKKVESFRKINLKGKDFEWKFFKRGKIPIFESGLIFEG